MKLTRVAVALLALPALGTIAAASHARDPMPIGELVTLSSSGASPEQVIQRIRASATTYALRGSDFGKLKSAGVPDPVLDYLQQSFVEHLDLLTRYWVLGSSLGGCGFCYPQPVDLSTMQSGYAHVSAIPPTRYVLNRPPGTPEWVPYPRSRVGGASLSVDQIIAMTGGAMPEDELVQRIRSARLTNVIDTSGTGAVRAHPLAGLGGVELARLKERGVPEAALDALQGQFLAQFIELERLRYQMWGKGSKP
jgi:hypothetical protein